MASPVFDCAANREGILQAAPMGLFFERFWRGWTRKYATTTLTYLADNYGACRGNPDRLMQVFENLLRNALRHRGKTPPRIHITAEKQAEEWLFAVRDNGPGVEPAYLGTIFPRPSSVARARHRSEPGPGPCDLPGSLWNSMADAFGPNRMKEPAARFFLPCPPISRGFSDWYLAPTDHAIARILSSAAETSLN